MEDGIKPVFVFEGKPPEMKQAEVVSTLFRTHSLREEKRVEKRQRKS